MIVEQARREGRVDVATLADAFAVTTETIRRDLSALERQGVVTRVHGGAIPVERLGVEPGVARRSGVMVEIAVRDSGRGIAPAFLPHVFERFRQEDQRVTRAHGGLGLGLAIVRHLAEMHGGSVAAVSAGEGKGATFIVRLPTA